MKFGHHTCFRFALGLITSLVSLFILSPTASLVQPRSFSGAGGFNRTHHRLFSLPGAPRPSTAADAAALHAYQSAAAKTTTELSHTGPRASPATALPARTMSNYADFPTHRGMSTLRQRTSCAPTEAVDAPLGNQTLTLHKDVDWMPAPHMQPAVPYDHRGIRAAHRAANEAAKVLAKGKHWATDSAREATGREFSHAPHHDPRYGLKHGKKSCILLVLNQSC